MKSIAIVVFPGTNCEKDTAWAFEKAGAKTAFVWHEESELPKGVDLVVLAGGYSYGDYLRTGAIAAFSPIMQTIKAYAKNGGKVLGICNGFQILLEAKLLEGVTLRNKDLNFKHRFGHIKVENGGGFLDKLKVGEVLKVPSAHAEGNYFIDAAGLSELEKNNQILLTYCDKDGKAEDINGAVKNIAGICNKERTVFGLMPHPERAADELIGSTDGLKMIRSILEF